MDIEALIQNIRDHYVEQFKNFVESQQRELGSGAGEVKLKLNNGEGLFNGLYCMDFCGKLDGETVLREMQPYRVLTFDRFTGSMGEAALEVLALRWDDVIIEHDIKVAPDGLDHWFDAWFDPEDKRYDPAAEVSGCIHSLSMKPGMASVDFGTAPPDAFWHLMKVLLDAGAGQIRISCTEGR